MSDMQKIEKKMQDAADSTGWILSQLVNHTTKLFEALKKLAEKSTKGNTLEKPSAQGTAPSITTAAPEKPVEESDTRPRHGGGTTPSA